MNNFIWTGAPGYQKSYYTTFCEKDGYNFAMVEFKKSHGFAGKIKELKLNIFADCRYTLYINGEAKGTGPACPGGDWGMKTPMPGQYYDKYAFSDLDENLEIYVQVKLLPSDLWDVSCGKGGFWAEYEVETENGNVEKFTTDE